MKRIGTTTDGGLLVELSAIEVNRLGEAHELIGRLVFDLQASAANPHPAAAISRPAPQAPRAAPDGDTSSRRKIRRPRGRPAKTADGTKTCSECGRTKPADDFYTGHGKCKPCTLALQKAKKAERAGPAQPAKQKPAPAVMTRACSTCKRDLPSSAFAQWQRQCKECKTKGAPPTRLTPDRRAMIRAADAKAKAAPREREPAFDRPVDTATGRVLPVGSGD